LAPAELEACNICGSGRAGARPGAQYRHGPARRDGVWVCVVGEEIGGCALLHCVWDMAWARVGSRMKGRETTTSRDHSDWKYCLRGEVVASAGMGQASGTCRSGGRLETPWKHSNAGGAGAFQLGPTGDAGVSAMASTRRAWGAPPDDPAIVARARTRAVEMLPRLGAACAVNPDMPFLVVMQHVLHEAGYGSLP
jgi:hypothetical protein